MYNYGNQQQSENIVEEEETPLIFDMGCNMVKCGFGGDDAPRAVFPNIVGRPMIPGVMVGMGYKDCWVGDEAVSKCGFLKIKRPQSHGMVKNWNDFEKIVHHSFTPEEHTCWWTQPIDLELSQREKTIAIMFETFNVMAMKFMPSSLASTYANGKSSGIIVNVGDCVTEVIPIVDQKIQKHAIRRTDIGGRDVTYYLKKIIRERGYRFESSAEKKILAQDLKEKMSFVALDYEEQLTKSEQTGELEKEFTLPDDSKITIGAERFRCQEILFKPSFVGRELNGVDVELFKCIKKIPTDNGIQSDCMQNIFLSGGGTMPTGFKERLENGVMGLLPKDSEIKITAPPERKYSSWIGASICSSLSIYKKTAITKDDYDEEGPTVWRKHALY